MLLVNNNQYQISGRKYLLPNSWLSLFLQKGQNESVAALSVSLLLRSKQSP